MYDPEEILQIPLRGIREALNDFPAGFFNSHLDVISQRLRALRPGQSYTAGTRGVPQPCDDARRFHGTSWTALLSIAREGFRKYPGPMSWDCGLVYTSRIQSTAAGYPQGLRISQELCGEVVASDVPFLRVLLVCNTDVCLRKVKIRRSVTNDQDGYTGGVTITAVNFHACAKAHPAQVAFHRISGQWPAASPERENETSWKRPRRLVQLPACDSRQETLRPTCLGTILRRI